MKEIILFAVSILPVFLIGLYIYKKDKEKEPSDLLIKLFLSGVLSIIPAIILEELLGSAFPEKTLMNLVQLLLYVFLTIALVEEICKWFFTYKLTYNNKEFDNTYDAIVYSTFVSLGFACAENIFYVTDSGLTTGLLRAVLSVPGHACYGIIMGCYLGLAKSLSKTNKSLEKKNIILSIIVPTILHGIYDYCLLTQKIAFIIIFLIFVIVIYVICIKKIKKVSKVTTKLIYKDRYCPNCGKEVIGNYCPICGRKNE